MKTKILYGLMAVLAAPFAHSQTFTINEIDIDTPSDDVLEFIELFDGGVGNSSLDGLVIVIVDGADEETTAGAFDLDGFTTDEDGYFVIGSVPEAAAPFRDSLNELPNGPDAIALYVGDAVDYPSGTTPLIDDTLLDVVIYDTNDPDDAELLALFGGEQFNEGADGDSANDSLQRNPDVSGPAGFFPGTPTPGAANVIPPIVDITISLSGAPLVESVSDSSPNEITVTLTRATTVGDLDVSLFLDDESEAELGEGDSVTIEEGSTSVSFPIFAVDDGFPDGLQTVTLTADPFGGGPPVSASFDVQDDGLDAFSVIFNEINAVAVEDLNGDGLVNSDDDFIEVVNVTASTIDLSFYEILESSDGATVHVFPSGTFLEAGCSLIVGSEGFFPGSQAGVFGTAFVQNVSEGDTLRITDTGDTMRLMDSDFTEIFAVTIPDLVATADQGSFALMIDGDATSGYAQHVGISTPSVLSSPGTRLDGTDFCTETTPITVSVSPLQILEDAGIDTVTATVSIPSALTEDFTVFILSTDLSGITSAEGGFTEAVIEAGTTSVDILLDAVDDAVTDDTQTIELVAGGVGFLNASTFIDVLDDGNDPNPLQVCDIAFVGYTSDNPDSFAFVTFVDIAPGAQINFTDAGWLSDADGFRSGEGLLTWTAPGEGVVAGTVITIVDNSPYGVTSSAGPDAGTVEEISGGGPNLATSGDQIFAFQGPIEEPILLAGIQMNGPFDLVADSNQTSTRPGVFATTGVIFFDPERDNAAYTGPTTAADLAAFKALVFDSANFAAENERDDVTFPSASFVFGEASDFAVTISDCAVAANGDFVISFTATGASDVYVTTDLQTFTLATDGAGVSAAATTYTDTNPPADRAFYLIQEAGAPAPGVPAS